MMKGNPADVELGLAVLLSRGLVATVIVFSSFAMSECSAAEAVEETVVSAEEFADSVEYLGIAVKKRDTNVWGTSPIIDRETGKVHLFIAEWDAVEMSFGEGW